MGTSTTPFDQARRLLRLRTVLGKDALVAVALSGEEALSEGFTYSLEVFSDSIHTILPEKIIGTELSFSLVLEDQTLRHFHGYVRDITTLGRQYGGQRSSYRLTIVSWLWFLSKTSDCRIFQEMTVEEVLEELFASLGAKATYNFKLTKAHPEHRFLVQYNETSQDFMCRLLRQEGIAFYIEHSEEEHIIHFIDDADSLPALEPVKLELQVGGAMDRLSSWKHTRSFVTGRYIKRAYNYKKPAEVQEVVATAEGELAKIPNILALEKYQYSGAFLSVTDGQHDVQSSRDQGVERHGIIIGEGSYRHLAAGHYFSVEQVPAGDWPDQGKEFTLTRIRFQASNQNALFTANFEAVPRGGLVYARAVREPFIAGLQTAVVTGPVGEEIHTDELGRIKVQFHWDREGQLDDKTTCWLRVMQPFAGSSYGVQFTPRVGQEVVVAFENGNPSRPFVLGALYHPDHSPPYAGESTQSGIRTRSTKGGDDSSYNEIRFDDKKDDEELYLRAQKDWKVDVLHNASLNVKNNVQTIIENTETRDITRTLTVTAGNEIALSVGSNRIVIDQSGIAITGGTVTINGKSTRIN